MTQHLTPTHSNRYPIRNKTSLAISFVLVVGLSACTTNPYTGEEEVSKAGWEPVKLDSAPV